MPSIEPRDEAVAAGGASEIGAWGAGFKVCSREGMAVSCVSQRGGIVRACRSLLAITACSGQALTTWPLFAT
jgi:hypothetical protein